MTQALTTINIIPLVNFAIAIYLVIEWRGKCLNSTVRESDTNNLLGKLKQLKEHSEQSVNTSMSDKEK